MSQESKRKQYIKNRKSAKTAKVAESSGSKQSVIDSKLQDGGKQIYIEESSKKPGKAETPPILLISRSALVLNILVGLVRVMQGVSYLWTIILAYAFFGLSILEVCFEPSLRKWRIPLSVMLIGGAVWFSMAVTFSRAPIDISVYTPRASPATDASIAGIGWDHHYTELVIGVTNPSQEDYHDLDLVFQPDQWVHKAALPESYGCQLSMVGASVIKISGHPKTGIMTFSGHLLGTKLGVDDSLGNAYDDYASQGGFRLRCSTFASVSTVTIVFALVSFKPELLANTMPPSTVSRGGFGLGVSAWKVDDGIDAFLEPRPSSRLLRYNGKYLKGLKPYRIDRSTSVSVE